MLKTKIFILSLFLFSCLFTNGSIDSVDFRNDDTIWIEWGKFELPDELYENLNLKYLRLDHSEIINGISPKISQLNNLTELILLDCHLSSLPSSVAELEKLKVLDLGMNDIDSMPDLSSLINLEWFRLTRLSDRNCFFENNFIWALPNLRYLEISRIENFFFPEKSVKFINLNDLVLTSVHLRIIPDWVSDLKELTFLNLEGNDIRNIQNIPTNVKAVNLSDNQINMVPDSLLMDSTLLYVDLSYNKIQNLPIKRYSIRSIYLGHNYINEYTKKLILEKNPMRQEIYNGNINNYIVINF